MQRQVTYAEAKAMKYPEPIVIAIAKDASGKCNPVTLGWATIASGDPPMWAVSIALSHYSREVFDNATEFVVAMPSEHQAEEALLFGSKSGRDCDKFAEAGAKLQPAAEIDCVLIADAAANFECLKTAAIQTGDHMMYIGEVVCSHANPESPNRLYTVDKGWKLAGRPRG